MYDIYIYIYIYNNNNIIILLNFCTSFLLYIKIINNYFFSLIIYKIVCDDPVF